MRFERSVVRMYGYSMLAIIVPTAAASTVIISSFSEVPRIRFLVPILALWMGCLMVSWLALVLYHAIQARFSRTM